MEKKTTTRTKLRLKAQKRKNVHTKTLWQNEVLCWPRRQRRWRKVLQGQAKDPNQNKIMTLTKDLVFLSPSQKCLHTSWPDPSRLKKKNRKGKKGKGLGRGKGKGSGRGRMSEAAEDAQLMAQSQSAQKVTRLEKQPGILVKECKMHPYQLEGLNWLIKLHDTGLNGILADEMGLGKTLQTISLLAWLREGRGVKGPHLVIVPKSVVGNWMNELKKWCPVIRGLKLLGNKDGPGTFLGLTFLACSIK
mmetsp:Transcript_24791/g.57073  ORF Transcript_24791/g.57073 Transcript_24791/m.57073 type:complete len:247 (+) Transcript_24791:244-984(+)